MLDAGLTYLMWMEGQYLWLDFQAAEEAGSVTCPVKHSALTTGSSKTVDQDGYHSASNWLKSPPDSSYPDST